MTNRELTYKFMELNYIVRQQIVKKLGLTSKEDEQLDDESQLIGAWFKRARDNNLLKNLEEEIINGHSDRN